LKLVGTRLLFRRRDGLHIRARGFNERVTHADGVNIRELAT
jgi:ABC-type uncharacterized transport system permease subunit